MTSKGELILAIYSLIIVLFLIIVDLKGVKKFKYAGCLSIIFTPTIIFLINIIWNI